MTKLALLGSPTEDFPPEAGLPKARSTGGDLPKVAMAADACKYSIPKLTPILFGKA